LRADIGRPAHRGKAQLAHACVVVANKKAAKNAMRSSSNAPAFPINGRKRNRCRNRLQRRFG
jgi:hypothetical protein